MTTVPQNTTTQPLSSSLPGILASMLGVAFVSGILGSGHGTGMLSAPPTAYSDTPALLVTRRCWIVLGLVVIYLALRRRRTLRAWALLAGYLLVLAGPGGEQPLQLRLGHRSPSTAHLTDSTCITVLCLSLAITPSPERWRAANLACHRSSRGSRDTSLSR